ncbi:hypothetical protein GH984_02870 [Spiribacter sp. C176]|uniref:Esterase n=1 Tax=Spiribacter salilacus TaxID=2664894 RepID=A0A6N7QMM2_9GAMM|nr:YqiA/YcfP family alpha/beta fold hydrolase [Spiribacter salilacus]MRH77641.1 hypothetical protein [Spiribacter salilacus]
MDFVYIHGFNSAFDPSSEKIRHLCRIGDVRGIEYDSFGSYPEILRKLASQISIQDETIFVGTSLGGFWAAEMGRQISAPSVIINPCVEPRTSLRKYIGAELTNHVTGESKTLSQASVLSYEKRLDEQTAQYTFLPLVLLDMGDEVIDSHTTQNLLESYPMTCFEGGSHRFEHMEEAIDDIEHYVNHCSYIDHLD